MSIASDAANHWLIHAASWRDCKRPNLTTLRDACRCDGCGRLADLAMCVIRKPLVTLDSKTGTQNRPYPAGEALMVRATLTVRGLPSTWEFNWDDRDSVRRFAADSDRCIRAGGSTMLERA